MHAQFQYLKHLITARNQHGVHSPFVYDYVTKGLYIKTNFKGTKKESILYKSISYFSIKKLQFIPENILIENLIPKETGIEVNQNPPFDLIYTENISDNLIDEHQKDIHNDSLILIPSIHKNKRSTNTWEALSKDTKVSVSIDLFYYGALFFRKEQVKEHFKIRI